MFLSMTWKSDLQLLDIIDNEDVRTVELTCAVCGLYQPQSPEQLKKHFRLDMRLDEIEDVIRCQNKRINCDGKVRLEISPNVKMEGFQGGLA